MPDPHIIPPVAPDDPSRPPDGAPIPPNAPSGTDRFGYVFYDAQGRILSPIQPGPGGRSLVDGAPEGAFTWEPLWLDEDGEVLNPRPPTLVRRNQIPIPGKKHKGRMVGGPQTVKRDRTYREALAPPQPKQTFKRTDLMVDFSGNVAAGAVFYRFLSPAGGKMDNFVISAPKDTIIALKHTPRDGGPAVTVEMGPVGDGVLTPGQEVDLELGGVVEFMSNQDGFVNISCILRSRAV